MLKHPDAEVQFLIEMLEGQRDQAVAQAAAFTLLNPHVYLDTVLLVGSMGAQQPANLQGWFRACWQGEGGL